MYQFEQHWVSKSLKSEDDRKLAKAFGITDGFLDKHGLYYTTVVGSSPNYNLLPASQQKDISEQIDDVIKNRFEFFAVNSR